MPGQQSYIVRLLRRTETLLLEEHREIQARVLGRIIQNLARADDVYPSLDRLYSVEGFDSFALRLMMSLDRLEDVDQETPPAILEYEARLLCAELQNGLNGHRKHSQTPHLPPGGETAFYGILHRFGRTIEDFKRKTLDEDTFKEIQPVYLDKILLDASSLEQAASSASKHDVVVFARVFIAFIQFVQQQQLYYDVRVVHLMNNANLTLQTVLEAVGAEDYETLNQTIELLRNPHDVLGIRVKHVKK